MAITPRKVSARVYRRRRIAAALAAMVVLGLVALAGGWGYTAFRFRQISSVHGPGLGKAPSDGSVNLLVVGSDTRQGLRDGGFGDAAGQRSDVVILVHLVPAARHATVLSIPRDLYVPVAGTDGSAKINSAFNHGPGPLVQTIQQSLRIPIHHYLLVNFDGFRDVVDALGGISMYFPRPVRDDNNGRNESGLQVPRPGCRRLDGEQALTLARSLDREQADDEHRCVDLRPRAEKRHLVPEAEQPQQPQQYRDAGRRQLAREVPGAVDAGGEEQEQARGEHAPVEADVEQGARRALGERHLVRPGRQPHRPRLQPVETAADRWHEAEAERHGARTQPEDLPQEQPDRELLEDDRLGPPVPEIRDAAESGGQRDHHKRSEAEEDQLEDVDEVDEGRRPEAVDTPVLHQRLEPRQVGLALPLLQVERRW